MLYEADLCAMHLIKNFFKLDYVTLHATDVGFNKFSPDTFPIYHSASSAIAT